MGAKFQNGCFAFCLFYTGIDKRNGKKINFKEHKICYYIKFCVTLFKERCEGFVGCISEPVNFWRSLRFMLMPLIPTIAMEWFQE